MTQMLSGEPPNQVSYAQMSVCRYCYPSAIVFTRRNSLYFNEKQRKLVFRESKQELLPTLRKYLICIHQTAGFTTGFLIEFICLYMARAGNKENEFPEGSSTPFTPSDSQSQFSIPPTPESMSLSLDDSIVRGSTVTRSGNLHCIHNSTCTEMLYERKQIDYHRLADIKDAATTSCSASSTYNNRYQYNNKYYYHYCCQFY